MKNPCHDHEGNAFNSRVEMCRHYGINPTTLKQRLAYGWTLEQALTNKRYEIVNVPERRNAVRRKPHKTLQSISIEPIDPNGIRYASMEKMCEAWSTTKDAVYMRMRRGATLKEALERGQSERNVSWIDHEGRVFRSKQAMCRYWKVSVHAYDTRIQGGYSIREALTRRYVNPNSATKRFPDNYAAGPDVTVLKRIEKQYYLVSCRDTEDIWTYDQISNYIRLCSRPAYAVEPEYEIA